MASENRASAAAVDLIRALAETPYKFNFFQAMRLIEAQSPGMDRIGRSPRPGGEPVRLGQEPSLAFAPSMLAEFRPGGKGKADYLSGFFFGMFGPNGPLPLHLTEHARDRERLYHDPTFRAFADIFHHRMMSMFYRAWAEARPSVQMDRPNEDAFAKFVGSTFGIALQSMRDRDALSDHAKLYMAGRLALQTKPAEGMQAMLEELFLVPMNVEQYVGEWMPLPPESHFLLGQSPDTGTLGLTATLGGRVWGSQHKFRIQCGPLNGRDFRRFLPGEAALKKLCATVRNYIGDELEWEFRLLIIGSEVPNAVLGQAGRLGWTSWIGAKPEEAVTDDVVLRPADLDVGYNSDVGDEKKVA
jgi:type VI secretion system protein ImpH